MHRLVVASNDRTLAFLLVEPEDGSYEVLFALDVSRVVLDVVLRTRVERCDELAALLALTPLNRDPPLLILGLEFELLTLHLLLLLSLLLFLKLHS